MNYISGEYMDELDGYWQWRCVECGITTKPVVNVPRLLCKNYPKCRRDMVKEFIETPIILNR